MLFINVYDASFDNLKWDLVLYSVIAIIVIFALGLLTCILTTKDNKRRGVILQCTFRSNYAIIGLSLASALVGAELQSEVEAIAAIVSAFSIPVFNILAVISLSIFVSDDKEQSQDGTTTIKKKRGQSVKNVLLNIVKNPLIIGVVLGIIFLGLRELEGVWGWTFTIKNDLYFLYKALSNVKAIASPLALVVLGGQFKFSAVKGMLKEIIVGTAWRTILAPLIGIGCAVLLSTYTVFINFGATEYPALIALFGSPVAVSSAIMAGQMGNDEQLGTQLVVWTSIVSIFTIFITVCILIGFGLLAV
jgi:hypothetical protein